MASLGPPLASVGSLSQGHGGPQTITAAPTPPLHPERSLPATHAPPRSERGTKVKLQMTSFL